jgi:hypothetical protein
LKRKPGLQRRCYSDSGGWEREEKEKRKRRNIMNVGTIIALVAVIPVMLFPAALIWYINIGGIVLTIREAREKKTAGAKTAVKA